MVGKAKNLTSRIKPVWIYRFLLAAYIVCLLSKTLICRDKINPLQAVFGGWLPYKHWYYWNYDALYNIVLLTPLILFLYMSFPAIASEHPYMKALKLCAVISMCIEIGQLVFSIGTFQIADLVYNSLSGVIGAWIYLKMPGMKRWFMNRKNKLL